MNIEICDLTVDDIADVRRLQSLAPTRHLKCPLKRFTRYFEALGIVEPAFEYFSRQLRILGAFCDGTLIGTIGLLQVPVEAEFAALSQAVIDHFQREFTEQEAVKFDALNVSLAATFIGAPERSYLIHSLHVLPEFRRQGVAKNLMSAILDGATLEQKACLFIETARERSLRRFVESFGFKCVKQTFSFSERLEYGTWGSLLFQHAVERAA